MPLDNHGSCEPQQAARVARFVGVLEGVWSARRGAYRILYEIFEDDQVVLIHRVQHRRDAYRPR